MRFNISDHSLWIGILLGLKNVITVAGYIIKFKEPPISVTGDIIRFWIPDHTP